MITDFVKKFAMLAMLLMFVLVVAVCVGCSSGNSGGDSEEGELANATNSGEVDGEVDGDAEGGNQEYQPEIPTEPIVYPFTFEDQAGNSVTLEHEPMYVVTIGSDITEAMFAFGRGIQIIGRAAEDSFPADVNDIPEIGTVQEPDTELIAELEPHAVLAIDKVPAEKIQEIKNKGIPVIVVKTPETIDETYDMIKFLGRALNGEKAAYSYAFRLESDISRVVLANAGNEIKRVCIAVDYDDESDKIISAKELQKYTFYEDVLRIAGGNSVSMDEEPHAIICLSQDIEAKFYVDEELKQLIPVRQGKIITIEEEEFDRRGPRCMLSIYKIAELLDVSIE